MRDLIERYETDRATLDRALPPRFSPARLLRLHRFLDEWDAALARQDFDALTCDARIDYMLFQNHLAYERRLLSLQETRLVEMSGLLPFVSIVEELEACRRSMEAINAEHSAARLDELAAQIAQVRDSLETGSVISSVVALRAAGMIVDLLDTLRTWFVFYDGYDPLFSWWAREPYHAARQALEAYATFLRETLAGFPPVDAPTAPDGESADKTVQDREQGEAIAADPIGRDALLNELAHELIPYTPEELIAIGDREYAWCEAEMRKAAQELGFGDDWMRAVEHVKTLHAAPGEQANVVRDLALEAIAFVEARDLVTIPPLARECWRREMMPPEMQKHNPFFLGGEVIMISFPTDGMSHARKRMSLRGNNRHFARATVQHELIPGHHLQLFMAERHRAYRRVFHTPFYVEGWAIHWEMLLWELGFAGSPEDRIGMLFWRMHRCARISFSLRFHLEQMTPAQCVDFLVERVGHERENALAEVRRSLGGDYPPLYQCAYMLGGLQMRACYRERVQNGGMTDRAFHDAVLQQNAIPIELLRAALNSQPLPASWKPGWRFYD